MKKDKAQLCSRCDYIYCKSCVSNISINQAFPSCSSCRKPNLMQNLHNYPRFLMNSLQELVFECKVCQKTMQTWEMDRHL